MVTIYDIAKACGCSSATVSKALNDYADVNINTKERILKVARQMGYSPNAQAQTLATKKSWNLGVLFQDDTNSGLTHYYFAQVLEAVKTQSEAKGYDVTFISKNLGNQEMTYLEHCRRRQVDGVIIACINFEDPQVKDLMDSEIPVVAIDYPYEKVSSVQSDNYDGLYRLTSHLLKLGHREIVFIYGHMNHVTELRIEGFRRAMKDHGVAIGEDKLISGGYYKKRVIIEKTEEILRRETLPTAIIYPDDYSAIWGIKTIRKAGLDVPGDLSVAGFDGIELGELISPQLTTVRQKTDRLGKEAVLRCIEMIESKTDETVSTTIDPELVVGESCRSL